MKTTTQRRSGLQPKTKEGIAISKKHLRESMDFNKRLAKEHVDAAKKGDSKYNKEHAKHHAKAVKEDAKQLKDIAKQIKKRGY